MERSELKLGQLTHNILRDEIETIVGISYEDNFVVTRNSNKDLSVYPINEALEDLNATSWDEVFSFEQQPKKEALTTPCVMSVDDKLKIINLAKGIANDNGFAGSGSVFDIAKKIETYIKNG